MRCECGGERFMAHQISRHDIVVDGAGNFLEDHGIYDSETPYGPFTCTSCGKEYEELPREQGKNIAGGMLKMMFTFRQEDRK